MKAKGKIRVLTVFGTRPEAIKMASIVKSLSLNDIFDSKVCVSGQHREMLDQVLELFDINPDFDLNVMKPNQDLYDLTSRILLKMREVLQSFKPDLVLVHGDTTTALAASLAAFYNKNLIGHVEAGLRTGDINSPWPEEANRSLISRLASFHFAPTEISKSNLLNDGVRDSMIYVTGNTVIDSLLMVLKRIDSSETNRNRVLDELNEVSSDLFLLVEQWENASRKLILITCHRRENFGHGILELCDALVNLAKKYPNIDWVYPVHLNPNISKTVYKKLSNLSNVYLIRPLGYEVFVFLMSKANIILTDSGGIQEEAPSLGKPVLVMRDHSERPEALAANTVKLIGMQSTEIVDGVKKLLDNEEIYGEMVQATNPYGDGKSGPQIVEIIKNCFKG